MDNSSIMSFKRLKNFIRKMRLSNHSILAIKEGTPLANMDNIRNIARAIETGDLAHDVLVIVVSDLDDIRSFPPDVMNKAGWYRIEALSKMIHKGGEQDANKDGS